MSYEIDRHPKRQRKKIDTQSEAGTTEQGGVPYDESLLERTRTQWQFGDWQSLGQLDRDTLQHHPDRAKLSLLAAAGRFQMGQVGEARQLLRLALKWGVCNELVIRILAAGIHNSLACAFAIAGEQHRAVQHFHSAILTGYPDSEVRLLVQARISYQYQQLGLPLAAIGTPGETFLDEGVS